MMIHEEGSRPDFIPPEDPLNPQRSIQQNAPTAPTEEAAPVEEASADTDLPDLDRSPEEEAEAKAAAREAFRRRRAEREAKEAADRVAALEEQVRKLSSSQQQAAEEPKAPARPNPKNYELGRFDVKYEEDLDAYMAQREEYLSQVAERKASEIAQARLQQNGVDPEAELHRVAEEVGKRGLDKYSDFREVVKDALEAMPIADEAAMRLLRLPNAEDVFYYLATNATKLEQVTGLDPMGQALELGKISQALGAKAKASSRPVTQAKPTPTIPRGNNGQFKNEADARYEKMLKATRMF